jgi:hypothetical protein
MLKYLLAIILIEALTELISKSEFFKPIREFFFNRQNNKFFNWLFNLLDCGYCTSVWIAWFVLFTYILLDNFYINLFFYGIILHRLSNIIHFIIDRIKG